jgi:hypothetical protein
VGKSRRRRPRAAEADEDLGAGCSRPRPPSLFPSPPWQARRGEVGGDGKAPEERAETLRSISIQPNLDLRSNLRAEGPTYNYYVLRDLFAAISGSARLRRGDSQLSVRSKMGGELSTSPVRTTCAP